MMQKVGEVNGVWAILFKIVLVFLPIGLTAQLAFLGWMGTRLVNVEIKTTQKLGEVSERIAKIESNRFTSSDGNDVWKAIGVVKTQIEVLREKLPLSFPPPETKLQIEELRREMKDLERKFYLEKK